MITKRVFSSGMSQTVIALVFLIVAVALTALRADSPPPTPSPAFLDADDQISLQTDQPIGKETSADRFSVRCGGDVVPVARVEAQQDPTQLTLYLKRPIDPLEIAEPLSVQLPDGSMRTVFARDVLSEPAYYYGGNDLGAEYTKTGTTFKVWSPVSSAAEVLLYPDADTGPARRVPLVRGEAGTWQVTVPGNLDGVYYQYRFLSYGVERTAPDIYGHAASPDLQRSLVVDLAHTDPPAWQSDRQPHLAEPTDAVVYEAHIRDFTSDPSSGVPVRLRGTYLGVVAPGTHVPGTDVPTGLAYLKVLGITDVHLLPFQSFNPTSTTGYNWGYETDLFNVPEPRYSTAPDDPLATIRQVKTMVAGLHSAGIGLVMDVVYNHTVPVGGDDSPYWATVPYYYVRTDFGGGLRNESGVGNALDDSHPMVRKFIVDSLLYWQREYHVDGFRFDLLGMFTPGTVRAVSDALHHARPDVLLYGEPWTGGGPTRFGKGAQRGLCVAVFNDNFRNALRGDLNGTTPGFALGGDTPPDTVRTVISGSPDFTDAPTETMNYVSIHDDMTYTDKVAKTLPNADRTTQQNALKLAGAMVLLSQGVPILEGGVELGRTKGGESNSYNKGDVVNHFDWRRGLAFLNISEYYRGLIALRAAHPAFRCAAAYEVRRTLTFLPSDVMPAQTVAFTLDGAPSGDRWRKTLVIFHGATLAATLALAPGRWKLAVSNNHAGLSGDTINTPTLTLSPLSAYVLYQD